MVALGRGFSGQPFDDGHAEVVSGSDLRTLHRFAAENSVEAVAFSPGDRELWFGGRNAPLRRVDPRSGALIAEEAIGYVRGIAFRPDDRQVALCLYEKGLLLRDLETREETLIEASQPGRVGLSYSADSTRLLWSHDNWSNASGHALLLDAHTGRVIRRWDHKRQFWSSVLHPAGDTAFISETRRVWIWDLETGERQQLRKGNRVRLELSPDGDHLYSAGPGSGLDVFHITARKSHRRQAIGREFEPLWSCVIPFRRVSQIRAHPLGGEIAVVGRGGIRLDVTSDPRARTLAQHRPLAKGAKRTLIRRSPSGVRVALSGADGIEVRRFPDNQLLWSRSSATLRARAIAWSPDGERLASGWGAPFDATDPPFGQLTLHASDTGDRLGSCTVEHRVLAVDFHPSKPLLASFSGKVPNWMPEPIPETLTVWSLPDLTPVWSTTTAETKHAGPSLRFSPNGESLALETEVAFRVWNTATWDLQHKITGGSGKFIRAFAYHPDGETLVAAISGELIELDSHTFARLRVIIGQRTPSAISFNGSGNRLLFAGREGFSLHDARTGEPLLRVQTPDRVHAAVFSHDEEWILTAGADQVFRAWSRHSQRSPPRAPGASDAGEDGRP